VGMNSRRAYVGRWSVEIAAERGVSGEVGIRQAGLALRAGREYEGYVIAECEEGLSRPAKTEGEKKTKAGKGAGVVLKAALVWGPEAGDRAAVKLNLKREWSKETFRFTAGKTTDDGVLELTLREGVVRIGAVSLMPADNIEGFRRDTVELLRTLGGTIYRWPGGNFVSGYQWWEAIGDRDKRPTVRNRAWPGLEPNDVGIDEFMRLVKLIDTEPLVVVNTGLGSVRMAAALVEYCNGPPSSRWGSERARNGHEKPYGVKWWGIGNETYGQWQLGAVPLERYVERHNAFVSAMKKVDPSIKVVAVGASGEWSRGMLAGAASSMDLLSEHFYCRVSSDLLGHVRNIAAAIRGKVKCYRNTCLEVFGSPLPKVPLALDEWNWDLGERPKLYGLAGVQYAWRDGLGAAAALCELIKYRKWYAMANWAQTVNVLGLIKTTGRAAAFEPPALPFVLFRHRLAPYGVTVKSDSSPLWFAAGITADRETMTFAVVNPTRKWRRVRLQVQGGALSGEGDVFLIAHSDPKAVNVPGLEIRPSEKNDLPGSNPAVVIETPLWLGFDPEAVPVSPLSVTLWRLVIGKAPAGRSVPFDLVEKAGTNETFLMLYAKGKALYAARSSDGLKWKELGDGKPVLELPAGEPVGGLSLCRGEKELVLVVERGGRFFRSISSAGPAFGPLEPVKIAGVESARLFDPTLVFLPSEKKYVLLLAEKRKGAFSRIVSSEGGSPDAFGSPEPALSRGHALRGTSLLRGEKNFLFFYDDRVKTCRMAVSGRPGGGYVVASPPLGDFGTSSPCALAAPGEAILYMKRPEKGFQVLRSNDLRVWREAAEEEISLPEGCGGAFAVLSVPESVLEAKK